MRAARTATLLLALLPALSWAQQTAPAPSRNQGRQRTREAVTSKVPLEDIRRFVAVYNAVRAAYVDPVDDKKLMQSAVRGLLLDLDPHSTYFNKEDAQAFDEQANGAYEGIGVELQQQPDNASMKVISPIDDTPAAKAGILAGDLIIAIDGKPISAIDASEPLRGPAGSKVVLTIVREGKPKPFDVSLTRQTIRVTSVRSRLLEPGYGYIRLSTFQADTGSDFQKHVQQLQEAVRWPAQGPGAGPAQQPGWPADRCRAGGR
jgi:carboxyl-terminal processing protease